MARTTKRLGETLIERGELTPLELDKALKAQLMFGGHLGTNLIELGLIDEDVLARCLTDMLGVREATREMLREATPEALAVVPRPTAERYRVVPLRIEDDTLHLAAVDPRDLGSMSSTTGYRLVPYVAPEIRMYEALERHYGVPRRNRFINLSYELGQHVTPAVHAGGGAVAASGGAVDAPSPPPGAVPGFDPAEMGAEFGYGRSWEEVAARLGDAVDAAASAHGRAAEAGSGDEGDAVERMVAADHGDELAAAFLDWAAPRSAGAILFAVRDGVARVWDWRGLGLAPQAVEKLRFPVTGGSIFTVLLGETSYRGPAPDDAGARAFYGSLRHDAPREIAVFPVHLDDRLVALAYLEGTDARHLDAPEAELERMLRRLGSAMNLVILKRRIRAR